MIYEIHTKKLSGHTMMLLKPKHNFYTTSAVGFQISKTNVNTGFYTRFSTSCLKADLL